MTFGKLFGCAAPGRIAVRAALIAGCAVLAGCSEQKTPNADAATLAAARYSHNGPPALTLFTMVNNRTGSGGHTSLMINASERVIFDPAGSFYADVVPERNDVLFGITPAVVLAYRGAHARSTHHVVMQRLEVTAEQAQMAYELALSQGRVPGAYCANSTSSILRQLPGFETMDVTFYPVKLSDQFATIPGVVTTKYYEDDDADLQKALAAGNVILNE